MTEKKTSAPKEGKGSRSMFKIILLVLILLLILGAGGGAAYYFLFRGAASPADEAAGEKHEPAAESSAKQASTHEPEKDAEHGDAKAPPIYHPLAPVTVNIAPPSPVRFLRVNLIVVTRSEQVIAAMDKHMPMIRNDMLTHMSSLTFDEVNSPEGKNKLREDLKTIITGILTRASEPSGIEEIIFTELVMQ